jgi:cell division protein FtsQ
MARKDGPTPDDLESSSQYESARSGVDDYFGRGFDDGEALDSVRLNDFEPDEESPFLRGQKRVPVRRGPIPKKTAKWLKTTLLGVTIACGLGAALWGARYYAERAPRFVVNSSDAIEIAGNRNAAREDILGVFGGDISRNIFKIPLDERKRKLEEIPWIESASVMRYLPNRLAVVVKERTPVAIVQTDSRIALIDATGAVMDMPDQSNYSFPVLTGFSESDPISTRAARVQIYLAIVRDLDSGGRGYSKDLSEVDVTNPEDIRITVAQGNAVVHMEKKNFPQEDKFLQQYTKYLEILPQCRSRFGQAAIDVDTRFDSQTPCRITAGSSPADDNVVPSAPDAVQVQPQQTQATEDAGPAVGRPATNSQPGKPKWHRKKH